MEQEDKMTPWFSPEENPARYGVYETKQNSNTSLKWFNYYGPKGWCVGHMTPNGALYSALHGGLGKHSKMFWRGFKENQDV